MKMRAEIFRDVCSKIELSRDKIAEYLGVEIQAMDDMASGKLKVRPEIAAKLYDLRDDPSMLNAEPIDEENAEPLSAEQVKAGRKFLGYTQERLGHRLGLPTAYICNWELGYNTPRPYFVNKFAAMLKRAGFNKDEISENEKPLVQDLPRARTKMQLVPLDSTGSALKDPNENFILSRMHIFASTDLNNGRGLYFENSFELSLPLEFVMELGADVGDKLELLKVRGNNLEPFKDGEIIILQRTNIAQISDFVLACNGEDLAVKRFEIDDKILGIILARLYLQKM